MEEKIIIKSKQYDIKKFRTICFIIGIILFAVIFVADFTNLYSKVYRWRDGDVTVVGFLLECLLDDFLSTIGIPMIGFAVPAAFGIIVYAWLSQIELIVTAERVYGTAAFGQRIDLPFDSISAIGTSMLKSITVSTASGRISFFAIKNRDKIHEVISKLLIERQRTSKPAMTIKQEIPQSNVEELKNYKELLDMGVISQEEFDAKKKQLLGL